MEKNGISRIPSLFESSGDCQSSQVKEQLEGLHEQGWTVHGRVERGQNSVGGKPVEWPMAVVAVIRGDSRGVLHFGNGRIVMTREGSESPKRAS